jgi:hypothetical protein
VSKNHVCKISQHYNRFGCGDSPVTVNGHHRQGSKDARFNCRKVACNVLIHVVRIPSIYIRPESREEDLSDQIRFQSSLVFHCKVHHGEIPKRLDA